MEKRDAAKKMTVAWGTAIRDGTEAAFIAHHELPTWPPIGDTAQADVDCSTGGDVEADACDAVACEAAAGDDASANSEEAENTGAHDEGSVCSDSDDADSAALSGV